MHRRRFMNLSMGAATTAFALPSWARAEAQERPIHSRQFTVDSRQWTEALRHLSTVDCRL